MKAQEAVGMFHYLIEHPVMEFILYGKMQRCHSKHLCCAR